MTNPVSVLTDKGNDLATLNNVVAQEEALLGPLTGIDNQAASATQPAATKLTFDSDQASPAKNAVIAPDSGGASVVPSGSTKVCQGTVYISGVLTSSTASRPN